MALQSAAAGVLASCVVWLWPRVGVDLLGWEHYWFGLGWLVLLAGPGVFDRWPGLSRPDDVTATVHPTTCAKGAFAGGLVFVALLLFGRHLGNYKLWLGVVYMGSVSLRLAGLTLVLRGALSRRRRTTWPLALAAAGIAALGGLLLLPWVGVDLVARWPVPLLPLLQRMAGGLLWGAISGAVLMLLPLLGMQARSAWMGFLAMAMGPGTALAVTWFGLLPMAGVLAVLVGLIGLRLAGSRPKPRPEGPVGLYWLLRALMLVWWGVGLAVALSAAWWQPNMAELFVQSLWLRALAAGCFVVLCLGLLAEYSLPLAGRPKLLAVDEQRKVMGVVMSAVALLLLLAPLLLMPSPPAPAPAAELLERSRLELIPKPVLLGPNNPFIELKVPGWLTNLDSLFVVSQIDQGTEVRQGELLAVIRAVTDVDQPKSQDELLAMIKSLPSLDSLKGQDDPLVLPGDLGGLDKGKSQEDPLAVITPGESLEWPRILPLKAGVDTAYWALGRRDVAAAALHQPARVAQAWQVHTPTGETFLGRSYISGIFLGREGRSVHRLKKVEIRYLYKNQPGRPPVVLEIKRVFVY